MNSILGDVTRETLSFLYKETHRKKNKKRITYIINTLVDIAIKRIQPYLYVIMAVLIILFLINCFQFFYYIRLIISNKNLINERFLIDSQLNE